MIKAEPVKPGMLTAYEQLKPMERIFVRAYVASDDPIKAILAVSPDLKGNSLANVRALDYMRRPLVQAAIAQEFQKIADRFEITAENVVQEIALLAFARMGDFATPSEDGTWMQLDLNKIPEGELSARLAAVQEFSLDETENKDGDTTRKFKFKLHDKNGSLDKLMKRFGLYAPERIEHSGPDGRAIETRNVTVTMSADEAKRLYEDTLDK
jgi:phage terminase small subunit